MNPVKRLTPADHYTTIEVGHLLGLSVRSVQLMVDRGELVAWKTSGGHRRIPRASVEEWRESKVRSVDAVTSTIEQAAPGNSSPSVLLIDDSVHFQKLVSLIVRQHFPEAVLHVADDGIAGLALYGKLQPRVLLVDMLLPGIDGAALITSLRSHAQFADSHLGVMTSLDESQRTPYAFALKDVPVIHKSALVEQLPVMLTPWLSSEHSSRSEPAGVRSAPL